MFRILKSILMVAVLATIATQSNARFLQPDWFDPDNPLVGTNRYSYCFNDPVNCKDPGGNQVERPGGVGPSLPAGARTIQGALTMMSIAHQAGVLGDNGTVAAPGGAYSPNHNSAADQALNNPNAVSMSDNPYGISSHGGKAGGDLPTTEDVFNGSVEENQDLIDFLEQSIEQRKEEYKENKHGLSDKARKGYRQKQKNEQDKIEEAKEAIALAGALAGAAEKEAEGDDNNAETPEKTISE